MPCDVHMFTNKLNALAFNEGCFVCWQLYDLAEVAHVVDLPDAFLIGPGAGSSRVAGKNCEASKLMCTNVCAIDVVCFVRSKVSFNLLEFLPQCIC